MSEPVREKVDADSLALRAPPRSVTRLNRKALAIALTVLGTLIGVAVMWALRPPKAREVKVPERPSAARVPRAEGLAALPADYTQVPKLGPPLGELGRPILQLEQSADQPPLPEGDSFLHDPDEDAMRAARLSAQAEADAAAKAPVFFKVSERRAPSTVPSSEEPDLAQDDIRANAGTVPPGITSDDANGQARKQSFLQASDHEQHARDRPIGPAARLYAIKAGDTLPAALITRINSDLPGTVTAMVTENIYDSDSGQHLLIPQGSMLVGRYDSEVTFGQSRVLLVWTQLVMENRATLKLEPLLGTDSAGQSGLHDRVDWHWKRIFAGAALSSLIGVAAELASPDRATDADGRVIVAARDSLHETTNEIGQQITRRNLNVQPTLSIREGYPMRVMINTDLMLPAYAARPTVWRTP